MAPSWPGTCLVHMFCAVGDYISLSSYTGMNVAITSFAERWSSSVVSLPACSGSRDGMLRVWQLEAGSLVFSGHEHGAAINDCCFTPDAATLLTASDDGTVGIWDVDKGRVGISWKEGQGMCPLHDSQRILKIPHITPSALYSIFLPAVSLPPHTHHHMPQTQVCPECIVQFSRNPGTDVSQPHRSAAEPALWQRPAGLPQNLGCQHLAVSLSDSVRRMHAPVCCFLSRWHYGCD